MYADLVRKSRAFGGVAKKAQLYKKYNPDLIRFVFWIFSISTALRFITQFLYGFLFVKTFTYFITVFSILQVVSILLFFFSIWGRIRPVGSQIREKKGEKF